MRHEPLCFADAQLAGGQDDRRAGAGPQIDEAEGVLGFLAVDVVEPPRPSAAIERHAPLIDPRCRRPVGLEAGEHRRTGAIARHGEQPKGDKPLDHVSHGGEEDDLFAEASADEVRQRQDRGKQQNEHKGGERSELIRNQAAAERRAQAEARRCGLSLRRRKREMVGTKRFRRRRRSRSCLSRRFGVEGERVQTIGEFCRQQAVYEAMPLDPAECGEFCRNDPHPIMRPAAGARARVPCVPVRFVDDVEDGSDPELPSNA